VIILLLVVGGLTALVVNAKSAHEGRLTGPVAKRLEKSGGTYTMSFPPRTPMARAWRRVLGTFPHDTKIFSVYDAAACKAVIVQSKQLASTKSFYPGLVDIEFQTSPKSGSAASVFDATNVDTVLVTLLDSSGQHPSC
jgi:hypothetical protein